MRASVAKSQVDFEGMSTVVTRDVRSSVLSGPEPIRDSAAWPKHSSRFVRAALGVLRRWEVSGRGPSA